MLPCHHQNWNTGTTGHKQYGRCATTHNMLAVTNRRFTSNRCTRVGYGPSVLARQGTCPPVDYGRPRPSGRWTPTAVPVHRPRHTLATTRCRRPASPQTGDRGDSGQVSEAEVMALEPSTGVPTTVVDLCDGASASRTTSTFVSAAPTSQLFYSSGTIPGIIAGERTRWTSTTTRRRGWVGLL